MTSATSTRRLPGVQRSRTTSGRYSGPGERVAVGVLDAVGVRDGAVGSVGLGDVVADGLGGAAVRVGDDVGVGVGVAVEVGVGVGGGCGLFTVTTSS